MTPTRIQLKRTAGWRLPAGAVIVDRRTGYGNPFVPGIDGTLEECLAKYEAIAAKFPLDELRGKSLACWCAPGSPCHADILLRLANPGWQPALPPLCLDEAHGERWSLFNADCVDFTAGLPDDCIDLSIYSPPFANLYIYGDSGADMGNCADEREFFEHYKFFIREKLRVTVPGRLTVIHCKDLPAYAGRDGYSGLKDFPGDIIRAHEECGWHFHSRVTIWKCPVTERERTNTHGLLHKSILADQSMVRQGMADYLIVMRKPPLDGLKSAKPIAAGGLHEYIGIPEADPRKPDSFHPSKYARKSVASLDSINIWRRYAEPVWWDINQQDVLNFKVAKADQDEKHICPLQLPVIRRAIQLWSLPGERILSGFTGIGSEGVCAVEAGRHFIGTELKPEYFRQATGFLSAAEAQTAALL